MNDDKFKTLEVDFSPLKREKREIIRQWVDSVPEDLLKILFVDLPGYINVFQQEAERVKAQGKGPTTPARTQKTLEQLQKEQATLVQLAEATHDLKYNLLLLANTYQELINEIREQN